MTKGHYTTDRLLIEPLQVSDADFIQELVNTNGWLQFIGERNIHTQSAAEAYIDKIIATANTHYWVVRLKTESTALGILTFIKREYLEFHDFGFAFLPQHSRKGYAFEASVVLLSELMNGREKIQAVTLKENKRSISLLEKLGFTQETVIEKEKLLVYGYTIFQKFV